MNRLELLVQMGLVAGGLAASQLAFADDKKSKKTAAAATTAVAAGTNGKLIDAALDCIKKAEACIAHCHTLLSKGDTTMADCLKSTLEMTPYCQTLVRLASLDAKSLKKFAALCAETCRECEKVCRVHESHHQICKDCADACGNCAKECEKTAA